MPTDDPLRVSALALKATPGPTDLLVLVDVTDTTMAASGTDKRTTVAGLPVSTATATALALKAPLASPTFTGTPAAPTATAGTSTTQVATTAYVSAAVAGLINAAPGALDTLKELADALGDDANFASTVTTALALKAPLASPTFTGTVTIAALSGLLKATAGVVSAAVAGTDYLTPTVDRYDRPFGAASVSAGGTTTLDLGAHNDWIVTLNGTGTLAFSGDTGNQPITLKIVQGGGGNFTMAWPGTVTWFTSSFTEPPLAATAGKATYVVLRRTGAGTYDGFAVGSSGT